MLRMPAAQVNEWRTPDEMWWPSVDSKSNIRIALQRTRVADFTGPYDLCQYRRGIQSARLNPGGMLARSLGARDHMDSARPAVTVGAESLLRVSNITVRFGGIVALEDVSFNVMPGQIAG